MQSELKKLNPDMKVSQEYKDHLLTVLSERFSIKLKKETGEAYLPGELIIFTKS